MPNRKVQDSAFAGMVHIVKVVEIKVGRSATSRNQTLSRLLAFDLCPQGVRDV